MDMCATNRGICQVTALCLAIVFQPPYGLNVVVNPKCGASVGVTVLSFATLCLHAIWKATSSCTYTVLLLLVPTSLKCAIN